MADADWVIWNRKEVDWKRMRVEKRQDTFQKNVREYRIESIPVKTGVETGDKFLF